MCAPTVSCADIVYLATGFPHDEAETHRLSQVVSTHADKVEGEHERRWCQVDQSRTKYGPTGGVILRPLPGEESLLARSDGER